MFAGRPRSNSRASTEFAKGPAALTRGTSVIVEVRLVIQDGPYEPVTKFLLCEIPSQSKCTCVSEPYQWFISLADKMDGITHALHSLFAGLLYVTLSFLFRSREQLTLRRYPRRHSFVLRRVLQISPHLGLILCNCGTYFSNPAITADEPISMTNCHTEGQHVMIILGIIEYAQKFLRNFRILPHHPNHNGHAQPSWQRHHFCQQLQPVRKSPMIAVLRGIAKDVRGVELLIPKLLRNTSHNFPNSILCQNDMFVCVCDYTRDHAYRFIG